ncbi:glycerol-3-phosphate dehydrogenase [Sphingomonas koreensis]|uniref:glycerol-3-phosphate dehydrogenase n=1 Tax=Sphingomonas koreensis TaxID=93064 RepID=UPI00082EE587|nr:glycerol-3-phosphate dehydrogenase [Sphingomonas koreensis]PJI89944.1 glycerol-3-phosphate dehydrogenase [Sphingomonas koreensis]RSU62596.1 glycerol-3-phosphate dehydrogenase [Sphingomonas koreensis]RSU66013.1 glycerol-3-phosphate dehydrogenase [Sphingomonas koreensis]
MTYDLLIAGGGINGCAIAREASLLGLSVLLVEKDDLAAHTSSASSKLIHGGLRYLETYEFRLVREALHERERMLAAAPHLIHPMAFVLPHAHSVRPWWMVRAGLYLYDLLGLGSSLPRSRALRRDDPRLAPIAHNVGGFLYWDAQVDDAALVRANAADAVANGAQVETGVAVTGAERGGMGWHVFLSDRRTIDTRAIVNATGPWVKAFLDTIRIRTTSGLRLIKGSHIVVPALWEGDHAYILQQPDRRVVFATPWRGGTMIGTTDVPVERPEDAGITSAEIDYLCAAANRYFRRQIAPADVTGTWSGIRALYDDGKDEARTITRDYVLELDTSSAPILSVFGGKITTARALGEHALAKLAPALGFTARPVTRDRPLP